VNISNRSERGSVTRSRFAKPNTLELFLDVLIYNAAAARRAALLNIP
jgi:hypothetical protein